MVAMKRIGTTALLAAMIATISGEWREAKAGLVYFSTSNGFGDPLAFETLDTSTGAVNVISSGTPIMIGLQFVNGQLYGEGYNSGELYQINSATGATTGVGSISTNGAGDGGSYYAAGPSGLTYFYNGVDNTISTLTPPSTTLTATNLNPIIGNETLFAVGPDGLIHAVVDGSNGETLDVLDPNTGVLTTGPTLSQNLSGEYDRARLFFDGSNLDVLGQNGLYTINMTTGIVTQDFALSLGQVWSATEFTQAAVPEPSSLALCAMAGTILTLAARRGRRRLASASQLML